MTGSGGSDSGLPGRVSLRLVVLRGPLAGRTLALDGDRLSVGRQAGNDVQLRDLAVSRRHCELQRLDAGAVEVVDLESRGGTFVNRQPVRRRRLTHGDVVGVGGSDLLFLDRIDPEADAAESPQVDRQATVTRELDPAGSRYLDPDGSGSAEGDLRTLFSIARALQEAADAETLARTLLESLARAVQATRGEVVLVERDGGRRRVATWPPGLAADRLDASLVDRLRQSRQALVAELADGTSVLAAPLIRGGTLLGWLGLARGEAPAFDPRHLDLVTAAASAAAGAFARAERLGDLDRETRRLRDHQLAGDLIGESEPMAALRALIAKVAPTDSTVLVRGESGTGKELVAKAIHRLSRRAERPFVAINCANLSETLLESELFGHERGAFTGAIARRVGKLEEADGGTVFLDEIGEIPPGLQARLLRVLQERCFERVGGNRSITIDVRVVAATNRDLEAARREGRFRDDLFYRLDVIRLELPPLRERPGDVGLLARHFAALHGGRLGHESMGLSHAAEALLASYDWPGNVRQLANAIERAVVLGEGDVISPADLPDEIASRATTTPEVVLGSFQESLLATKRSLIRGALDQNDGDLAGAAESLGIHVNSLHRLLRNLGMREET